MKFYRLHRTLEAGSSAGYEWFLTADEAWLARLRWLSEHPDETAGTTVQEIKLDSTSRGSILRLLSLYASHPDNG